MTDGRTIPHSLREPNRCCTRCGDLYYGTKGKRCPSCRVQRRHGRQLPPDHGGDDSALLPVPAPIQRSHIKSYAEYLADARQAKSKHEVIPSRRQGEDSVAVDAAIKRVRAMETPSRKLTINRKGYAWKSS